MPKEEMAECETIETGGGSFAKNIHKIIYKKTTTQNQHFSNFEKIIL